ncbi:hypothetical protein ACKGJO_06455 [Gracilimonas sp. Q87]|uniref:hypothetical protein n=1 Tax=Gracilimonas sp. Q87 TaxID=3384766 RepID=UPI003983E219
MFFASVSTLAFIEVNENTGLVVEDVTVLDTTTVYELKFVGSLNSIQVKSNNPTLYAKGDTLRLLD